MNSIEDFTSKISESLKENSFVKLNLGNYKGSQEGLKAVYAKIAIVKNSPKLSFTYRYKTKDVVKNYSFEEAKAIILGLLNNNEFRAATLFTLQNDISIEIKKDNSYRVFKKKPTFNTLPSTEHDKSKNRKIDTTGKHYLRDLKITDANGNVYPNAQDKYKQINHYIEILSYLLKDLPQGKTQNIADMGAGKGYLTFALYDYLTNTLKRQAKITGVEYRKDLVELCNDIAQKSNFDNLCFVQGSIDSYTDSGIDVLIALHACDTATDDAIAKGINCKANLIVVAPCCHKQIRKEITKNKPDNELDFLLQYGIFLERQSEMVTDGIRALILEFFGYNVKVLEFVSDAHTPKNVMIVGSKKPKPSVKEQSEILNKLKVVKEYFGISYHHLETSLETGF